MNDQEKIPVDLSALGPPLDANRLDALVAASVARGADELRRRRAGGGIVRVVVAWRRPLLAVSGLAAAASLALLVRSAPARSGATAETASGTIAEALGIPAVYAESVEGHAAGGNKQ